MLFNSIEFALFLPLVFLLYWYVFSKKLRLQNLFLLVASYFFYGWWDWRFLLLIFASTCTDYFISIAIARTEQTLNRKWLRAVSFIVNLGLLGLFKYYNFFIDSFADMVTLFGFQANLPTLRILLPVGISFYTFQTLGYTLDVYKKKIKPERDFMNFMLYVSFFPQLVAGPIERARNLLPQINRKRTLSPEQASDGLRMILSGLFKKMVIADNLANSVDYIFANYTELSSLSLLFGGFFFMVQIYCDFAGYSEIAIGTAKLLGFKLVKNFNFPFYSVNAQELWTKWHISLSNWFRDYLLLSLKSSFNNRRRFALNYLLTLSVIGFWHGADWTYMLFGFVNGLYILPHILFRIKWKPVSKTAIIPSPRDFSLMTYNFVLSAVPSIFFRSPNFSYSMTYFKNMAVGIFTGNGFAVPPQVAAGILFCAAPLVLEWFVRTKEHPLDIAHIPKPLRWSIYIVLIVILLNVGNFSNNQFIYFQF